MLRIRVIPALLLKGESLVKSINFNKYNYIGDSINTVRIFNQMGVDELIFLDIFATINKQKPPFKLIENIASECFMPFAYGGGIRSIEDMRTIFSIGVEKIILNSYAYENPEFIRKASEIFGNQSIIVSVDVKKRLMNKYEVYLYGGKKRTKIHPVEYCKKMEIYGAGEIFLNSINRDGTWQGYDIPIIKSVTDAVTIPVICCGGAKSVLDFREAVKLGGATAVAAGSMFFFQGKEMGVLINFPPKDLIEKYLFLK